MLAPGSGSLNNVKTTKANRGMFRHLESTRISRSSNFPVAIKWRNKRNLTKRCFFNIYVLLNKYFVSISSLTEFSCNHIFMLFFCLFVMLQCRLIKRSSSLFLFFLYTQQTKYVYHMKLQQEGQQ